MEPKPIVELHAVYWYLADKQYNCFAIYFQQPSSSHIVRVHMSQYKVPWDFFENNMPPI